MVAARGQASTRPIGHPRPTSISGSRIEEVHRLRRVAYESSATADEKHMGEVHEKQHTEELAEVDKRITKEKGREKWRATQEQTKGIIPIKLQTTYWTISALAVTSRHLYFESLATNCGC